jgi:hypothetical protein
MDHFQGVDETHNRCGFRAAASANDLTCTGDYGIVAVSLDVQNRRGAARLLRSKAFGALGLAGLAT